MPEAAPEEVASMRREAEKEGSSAGRSSRGGGGEECLRVSIYRGHPLERRETFCKEPGRLIRLPSSLEELKNVAGTYIHYIHTYTRFLFPIGRNIMNSNYITKKSS